MALSGGALVCLQRVRLQRLNACSALRGAPGRRGEREPRGERENAATRSCGSFLPARGWARAKAKLPGCLVILLKQPGLPELWSLHPPASGALQNALRSLGAFHSLLSSAFLGTSGY